MHRYLTFFDVSIPAWTVFTLFGVFLCWFLFYFRSRSIGYDYKEIFNFLVYGLPVGFFGGTMTQYVTKLVSSNDQIVQFGSGMTVTGAIISCSIYAYVYSRLVLKLNPLAFLDQIAFMFPLSILIGRVGCLLEGCCYGHATDSINHSFFTTHVFQYEPTSAAYQSYMSEGLDLTQAVWNLPLIMISANLIVLIVVELLYRNREKMFLPYGFVAVTTLWLYSMLRLMTENFRMEDKIEFLSFNPWQTIVFFMFMFASVTLVVLTVNKFKLKAKDK